MPLIHKLPRWVQDYQRNNLAGDVIASIIVALLLIPQGLAYAQLAGLPPMAGLYASIGPLLVYGFVGTSMPQSVGPMAITSAMTAAALTPLATAGSPHYLILAATLTLLSGLILTGLGLLKLGQITRILSLPVVQGFSAGTALLIALGQTGSLLGTKWQGDTLPKLLQHLPSALAQLKPGTMILGVIGLLLLWLAGSERLSQHFARLRLPIKPELFSKILPLIMLCLLASMINWLNLTQYSKTLGPLPSAAFDLQSINLNSEALSNLLAPALLIGLAGFLQSITVAQQIASHKQQYIDPNRELLALGHCNLAAALFGGMPVSGGFSRTVVNSNAGAHTPLAGILSALWLVLALWMLLPYLAYLPQPLLAATIILATTKMISWQQFRKAWHFDRRDGTAWIMTFAGVLLTGPMLGIAIGIGIALLMYLLRSQQPHIAVVGRVPNSEHYRNVLRFQVETQPDILAIRIDENLYFANINQILEKINQQLANHPETKHLVLILSAVNSIDYSALNALQSWHNTLKTMHIELHLAEVKGPVLDTLLHGDLLSELSHPPFISTHAAMQTLALSCDSDYTI
ncbi:sulfate permease [Chitinibacter fontanus]|uniref:Sulfate permease n=1 Tax=Chitinibacter fontanus TaxID=1737446 RepID=A0A7D5VBS6_9NEIS|nr:sulfate permease [Chitinibacter fontanus]QLI83111.1 sulfate permease [Chitinibacter fontanus]